MDKGDLEKRLEDATRQHAGFIAQFQEMQACVLRSEGAVIALRQMLSEQEAYDKAQAATPLPRQQRRAAARAKQS
jgi:hypothetical protein